MKHLHIALWGVLPYLVLTVLVAGTAWRYRYDRFGFTTRSSQLHEHRLLSVGGPLFHYGLLFVAAWHAIGLLVPESLTERVHVHEWLYHANALVVGGTAGLATLAGLAILLGVSVWFRSLLVLDPNVPAMSGAPFAHQLHALLGMALFALWPFSRLVHAFTAPLGHPARTSSTARAAHAAALPRTDDLAGSPGQLTTRTRSNGEAAGAGRRPPVASVTT